VAGSALLRWLAARLLGDADVVVADRLVSGGEFHHAVEHHAEAARVAAVEPEDELVQVGLQVRRIHLALVGAQEPPLG